MKTLYKRFSGVELKAEKKGSFTAKIITLNVVDKDGDVTLPGAVPNGKEILISSYMHGSWSGGLPVGKGIVREEGDSVYVDGEFNLNTDIGKEHYETLKFAPELSEWSYGFQVLELDEESDWRENPKVWRVFKSLDIFEASPVLRGAGVDTGLLSIKSEQGMTFAEHSEAALTVVKEWDGRVKSLAELRLKEGRSLSDANRKRVAEIVNELKALTADLHELSAPEKSSELNEEMKSKLILLKVKNEQIRREILS
jgi:hypothetical protein